LKRFARVVLGPQREGRETLSASHLHHEP